MDVEKSKPFSIVLFLPRKAPEVEQIEIVPSSWIDEKDKIYCYYPNATDYKNLKNWTKMLKTPSKSWELFEVEILGYGKNWKQAQRRFDRACVSNKIRSTDEEQGKIMKPVILTNKNFKKSLREVPKMPLIPSSPRQVVENDNDEDTALTINASHLHSTSGVQQPKSSNFRQMMDDLEREERDTLAEMDPTLKPLQKYIDILFRKQTLTLQNYIESNKRSLMYDMNRNTNLLENQIIANNHKVPVPATSLNDMKEKFDENLPISDLQVFKNFDESLASEEHKDKYNSFSNLIRVCSFGQTKVNDCIHKIFPQIITKAVEINYSGAGKKVHGVGKLDFSATNTFKIIESVMHEKFPDQPQVAKLRSLIGTWLSGAPDRDHGRALRLQETIQRYQNM